MVVARLTLGARAEVEIFEQTSQGAHDHRNAGRRFAMTAAYRKRMDLAVIGVEQTAPSCRQGLAGAGEQIEKVFGDVMHVGRVLLRSAERQPQRERPAEGPAAQIDEALEDLLLDLVLIALRHRLFGARLDVVDLEAMRLRDRRRCRANRPLGVFR